MPEHQSVNILQRRSSQAAYGGVGMQRITHASYEGTSKWSAKRPPVGATEPFSSRTPRHQGHKGPTEPTGPDVGAVQKPNTAGKGNFVATTNTAANTCNLNWHFIEARILP